METYTFLICGVELKILADRSLVVGGHMPLFFHDGAVPALSVLGRTSTVVQAAEGDVRLRERERLIAQQGTVVSRFQMANLDVPPYARLDYDLAAHGQATLTVGELDWTWATDYLRLWSTLCLPQLLLPFRTLIFHASYIGHEGRGILFTAPSQTGKSTQAELWRVHRGARVLNGDKAGISLRETPMAHGVPFSGTSGICENVSLPLRAIVVLSQAPENSVRRLGPSEAVAALCPNLFVDSFIQEEWQMALNLLLDLVASVPVYALACTPDERAVETLEQALNQQNGSERTP